MKVAVENDLIVKAQTLTGIKTKKAVVEEALRFFIAIESQKKLAELWGNVKVDVEAYK